MFITQEIAIKKEKDKLFIDTAGTSYMLTFRNQLQCDLKFMELVLQYMEI